MKENEVLKYLKEANRKNDMLCVLPNSDIGKCLIKALEKQIPKNPIIHINDIDKGRLACCPVCDSNVDWTYEGFWRKGNPKYCKNCGQAIDWSD